MWLICREITHPLNQTRCLIRRVPALTEHLIISIQRRRPGAEFGGRKIVSRTKISESRFFRKKCPFNLFTAKISDDLFFSHQPFARIRKHYFSKYWGTNAWAVPHLKFLGGPSPRSPPLFLFIIGWCYMSDTNAHVTW